MKIVEGKPEDLEEISRLEKICFPGEQAAGREQILNRLRIYPNHFWLLKDVEKGLAGYADGLVTSRNRLEDELYDDPLLHEESGDWQMIFGLAVQPEFRRRGYGGQLLRHVIKTAQEQGRKGLVLTCKEALIPYYTGFGFCKEGISLSIRGEIIWQDMRLNFTKENERGDDTVCPK